MKHLHRIELIEMDGGGVDEAGVEVIAELIHGFLRGPIK
jgi:hypothetical protein